MVAKYDSICTQKVCKNNVTTLDCTLLEKETAVLSPLARIFLSFKLKGREVSNHVRTCSA